MDYVVLRILCVRITQELQLFTFFSLQLTFNPAFIQSTFSRFFFIILNVNPVLRQDTIQYFTVSFHYETFVSVIIIKLYF